MIELLIFLFTVNACIPADEGWDCNVIIYVYEKQGILDQHWKNEGNEELTDGKTLRAFWHYLYEHNKHIIRIHEPALQEHTPFGCLILWHELLHAMGYAEEEIPLCKY